MSELVHRRESLAEMEARHEQECEDLEQKIAELMKTSNKKNRAQNESKAIQMRFDLKAQHIEEEDDLEEDTASGCTEDDATKELVDSVEHLSLQAKKKKEEEEKEEKRKQDEIEKKLSKSRKKQDKKSAKVKDKQLEKEQMRSESGPSMKEIETEKINSVLQTDATKIKTITSDGNCLYRAIVDQLELHDCLTYNNEKLTWSKLRQLAASYMRANSEDFLPFLGLTQTEYEEYCSHVESDTLAIWGGQLEIKAICSCMGVKIHVYSADSPVLLMGVGDGEISTTTTCAFTSLPPLKISYHKHFYSLGAHYNSVIPSS